MLPRVFANKLGRHTTLRLIQRMIMVTDVALQGLKNDFLFWKTDGAEDMLQLREMFFRGI
jgi:hypothetical protein